MKMGPVGWVAFVLVVIGGLNWGLVAFNINPVESLGDVTAKIVYILVGLSAIFMIVKAFMKKNDTVAPTM